jgi:phosphopantetheinyl transferase
MALYKIIDLERKTKILVWKITETFDELFRAVALKDVSLARLENMKSQSHQKGFLSVRKLLVEAGYTDFDLYYDVFGKPHLNDGTHISISHSFEFSAIILSDKNSGIDIEQRREKIKIIATKFAEEEFIYLAKENNADFISKLTVVWGIKESVFKVRNEVGISFKDHIFASPFEITDKKATAFLRFNGAEQEFEVQFEEIENYTMVWVFEK